MAKNTGKVREKSGNFVSPEKWEPCMRQRSQIGQQLSGIEKFGAYIDFCFVYEQDLTCPFIGSQLTFPNGLPAMTVNCMFVRGMVKWHLPEDEYQCAGLISTSFFCHGY